MKRILSIGRLGGQRMDEALIERLARKCLYPIVLAPIKPEFMREVIENIKDAIREAYLDGLVGGAKREHAQGKAEVRHAGDDARTQGGV